MTTLLRGRVITPEADLDDAVVAVEGDSIAEVRPPLAGDPDVTDDVLLPGLVDAHCHGGGGGSFTVGDAEQVAVAARHHLGQGTTSLIGSAVTDSPERMLAAISALADAAEAGLLAGVHAEGPFLSHARCGAQDPAYLLEPDLGLAAELVDAGRGRLRVMTVAPELPGAVQLADLLAERGVLAAVGHTEADAATTDRFLRTPGSGLVTHLFNGMPPMHHRAPGPVGGALSAAADGAARVELIADGVHLSDDTVRTMYAVLGGDRILLVTDAMAAAGMPDGDYQLGPRRVRVVDGTARLAERDSIAGGTTRLLDVVRRLVGAGLDPVSVVASASLVPAAALGLDRVGALRAGLRADLVVTDADLRPQRVMRAGEWVR